MSIKVNSTFNVVSSEFEKSQIMKKVWLSKQKKKNNKT